MFLAGCATTRVDGEVPVKTDDISALRTEYISKVYGDIEYVGNKQYLPVSLVDPDPSSPDINGILFKYEYKISYDVKQENGLQVFNPLLMVGVPKSNDAIFVSGFLEMTRDNVLIKRYEKSLVLSKNKSLFSEGETLTEMRKKGLLLVRDDIDRQLHADKDFWGQQQVVAP